MGGIGVFKPLLTISVLTMTLLNDDYQPNRVAGNVQKCTDTMLDHCLEVNKMDVFWFLDRTYRPFPKAEQHLQFGQIAAQTFKQWPFKKYDRDNVHLRMIDMKTDDTSKCNMDTIDGDKYQIDVISDQQTNQSGQFHVCYDRFINESMFDERTNIQNLIIIQVQEGNPDLKVAKAAVKQMRNDSLVFLLYVSVNEKPQLDDAKALVGDDHLFVHRLGYDDMTKFKNLVSKCLCYHIDDCQHLDVLGGLCHFHGNMKKDGCGRLRYKITRKKMNRVNFPGASDCPSPHVKCADSDLKECQTDCDKNSWGPFTACQKNCTKRRERVKSPDSTTTFTKRCPKMENVNCTDVECQQVMALYAPATSSSKTFIIIGVVVGICLIIIIVVVVVVVYVVRKKRAAAKEGLKPKFRFLGMGKHVEGHYLQTSQFVEYEDAEGGLEVGEDEEEGDGGLEVGSGGSAKGSVKSGGKSLAGKGKGKKSMKRGGSGKKSMSSRRRSKKMSKKMGSRKIGSVKNKSLAPKGSSSVVSATKKSPSSKGGGGGKDASSVTSAKGKTGSKKAKK